MDIETNYSRYGIKKSYSPNHELCSHCHCVFTSLSTPSVKISEKCDIREGFSVFIQADHSKKADDELGLKIKVNTEKVVYKYNEM